MADAVNLADEFAPPESLTDHGAGTATDLAGEFDLPDKQDQRASINDAVEKMSLWKKADPQNRGLLLERWFPEDGKEIKRTFWETQNTPLVNLPRMNAGPDVTTMGMMGPINPSIATGIYNGIANVASSLSTPLTFETAGTFGALTKIAQGTGPAAQSAKWALTALKTYFGATMAKGAGESAGKLSVDLGNPDVSKSEKTETIVDALATSAMAVASGASAVHDVVAPSKGITTDASTIESPTEEVRSNPEPATPSGQVAEGITSQPEVATGTTAPEVKSSPQEQAVNDYTRYHEIQAQWKTLMDEGKDAGSHEIQTLWKENEEIKNRHEGMPPPPIETPPDLATEFEAPPVDSEQHQVLTEELAKQETPESVVEAPKPETTPVDLASEVTPPKEGPTGIQNAIVDQERVNRGLTPAMETAAREFGTVWEDAMKRINENPNSPKELVDSILEKPRALSDTENAVLLHRQVDLQNQFDKISERINEGSDTVSPDARAYDNLELARISDELLDVYNAGRMAGTEQGRGLNARKMLANEDFSLAKMTTMRRAVNEGRPLTEKQAAEVQALHDKIAETQKAYDEYKSRMSELLMDETPPRVPRRTKAPGGISAFLSERAAEARARIAERTKSGRVLSGIDPIDFADHVIVGAEYIAKGVEKFGEWSAEMIKEFGESITPHLETIFDRAKRSWDQLSQEKTDEKRLRMAKTRSINQAYDLEQKIANGDFTPTPKPSPVRLDAEGEKLAAEAARAKQDYQEAIYRDRLNNRTSLEKTQDTLVRWRRGFILSGVGTLAKLTGAAVLRAVTTPIEELVGSVLSKAIPDVMEKAPRHGEGVNVAAEAKAITSVFTKGMADSYKTLRTGKSDLDVLYGKGTRPSDVVAPSFIDFFGHLHGAMKAPIKRAEFERSLEHRTAFAIRNGVDVLDPMIQTELAVASYKDANRAIFMQDNVAAKAWNGALQTLENAKSEGGKRSVAGKAIATTARVLMPIVKVPTNIVAEATEYAVGSITGSVKIAKAYRDGIENLTPEQADIIARQMKKGALGAAALAIGYFSSKNVGGFYQQGEKRNPKDVQAGDLRFGDVDIGKSFIHAPLIETMQLGATIRRVQEQKVKGGPNSLTDSIGLATLGLAEELPFVRTPIELSKLFDKNQRAYAEGSLVKGLVVPQALSSVAAMTDRDASGNPIKRKVKTIPEHVESGIPGLRETLPVNRRK